MRNRQLRAFCQQVQLAIGDDGGDLQDAIAVGIQPGHFEIDPNQTFVGVVCRVICCHVVACPMRSRHDTGSSTGTGMLQTTTALGHYAILTAMLAPAFFLTATAALLASANTRLARVVDRLRALLISWEQNAPDRAERDDQIRRHRERAHLVLRACRLLYGAVASFVGTSLALAIDALLGFRLGAVPTATAVLGVLFLLAASVAMWREVSLAVKTFNLELDQELLQRRG